MTEATKDRVCPAGFAADTYDRAQTICDNCTRSEELSRRAVAVFGAEHQLLIAAEECAELTEAIMHRLRGRSGAMAELVTECADAIVAVGHVRTYLETHGFDVEARIRAVLDSLEERIARKCDIRASEIDADDVEARR